MCRWPLGVLLPVLVLFGVGSVGSAAFVIPPYVILADAATEMQLQWQLDSTADSLVEWGTSEDCADGALPTTELSTRHIHHVTLAGLLPNTRYFYRVTVGTLTEGGSFHTPPASSPATDVVFYGLGDSQYTWYDETYFPALCRSIRSEIDSKPERQTFCLVAGDWAFGPPNNGVYRNAWTDIAEEWNKAWPSYFSDAGVLASSLPLMGCVGNHDIEPGCFGPWGVPCAFREVFQRFWPYEYRGGQYGSFDWGPVHVTVIDLYSPIGPASAQLAWLEEDLSRASSRPWTLVLLHEPFPGIHGEGEPCSHSDCGYILSLVVDHGVDLVIAGHQHCDKFYEISGADGSPALLQLTLSRSAVPTGAYARSLPSESTLLPPECKPMFYRFAISGQDMVIEGVNRDGEIVRTHEVEQRD